MATQDLTDTHLEAVARINAAGFRARLVDHNGSLSIQVKIRTGDIRIKWDNHNCHVSQITTKWNPNFAPVIAPRGFHFVHIADDTILSYPAGRGVDALVFAHLFEQARPIVGPMSLNRMQMQALELSLAAVTA